MMQHLLSSIYVLMFTVFLSVISQCVAVKVASSFIKTKLEIKTSERKYHFIFVLLVSLVVVLVSNFQFQSLPIICFVILFLFYLSIVFYIDCLTMFLPFRYTAQLIVSGVVFQLLYFETTLAFTYTVSFLLYCAFLMMRYFVNNAYQKEVFGMGDVYLITGLSLWLSAPMVFYAVILAAILGMIFIKIKECTIIPFAPFLCFSAALVFPFI